MPGLLAAIVTFAGTIAALWLLIRKTRRKWKSFWKKVDTFYDSIVGSDAIVDPETGKVLRPAKESLGARVSTIEDWQAETAHALKTLAANQEALTEVKHQMATLMESLAERDKQGLAIVEQWTEWRETFMSEKENAHAQIWEALRDIEKRLPAEP